MFFASILDPFSHQFFEKDKKDLRLSWINAKGVHLKCKHIYFTSKLPLGHLFFKIQRLVGHIKFEIYMMKFQLSYVLMHVCILTRTSKNKYTMLNGLYL